MEDGLIGDRLGKYEIREEIGRGGMGAVYRAYDPALDRYVAIKVLAPHLVWEGEFVQRFLREARAAARLKHTHIVTIHDVGQVGNTYYFVMEYLEGATLTSIVEDRGAFSPDEVIRTLRPVADALGYAHGQGLVHRDVKPGNIIVSPEGLVTLTDFGIVRAAQETRLTATGTIVGTPEYMSPEQAKGQAVGASSDQYSLAVVAYEMLSGRVPFEAESTLALLHKIVYDPLPPIREVKSDLPEGVEGVLKKALAKEPADRYETAGDFVAALDRVLAGEAVPTAATAVMESVVEPELEPEPESQPVSAPEPVVVAPAVQVEPAPAVPDAEDGATRVLVEEGVEIEGRPVPPRRPARHWGWVVGIGAVVALAAGAVVALGSRGPEVVNVTATPKPVLEEDWPVIPTARSPSEGLNAVEYYGFNVTHPPFDDPRVRQAFALAVDRVQLAEVANGAMPERGYVPATTFVPPEVLGAELYPRIGLAHDPDRARELLAQAGYPGGQDLPPISLWVNEAEIDIILAEEVVALWQEVLGAEAELVIVGWDEYIGMLNEDPPPIWRLGWRADYVDPHNFLHDSVCAVWNPEFLEGQEDVESLNQIQEASEAERPFLVARASEHICLEWRPTRFRWENDEYERILRQALEERDVSRRLDLYAEAERILCEEEAVAIPLLHLHREE